MNLIGMLENKYSITDSAIQKAEEIDKSIDKNFIAGHFTLQQAESGIKINKTDLCLRFKIPYHQKGLIWRYLETRYNYRNERNYIVLPFPENIINQIKLAEANREVEAKRELESRKKEIEQRQIQKAKEIEERLLKKAKEGIA